MEKQTSAALRDLPILIAEDEYYVADELAKAIRLFGGIVVGPAASRERALKLVAAGPVAIAIIDIHLGGEDAFPVVEELASRSVPVVFATGLMSHAIPQPFRHYPKWVKPYLPLALVTSLKHVLAPPVATH